MNDTHRKGFTLVELLTVIAIIGILAAILIPVVSGVIDKANNAKSVSNLADIAKMGHLYSNEHKGKVLPAEGNIDRHSDKENWYEIITYMSTGTKELAKGNKQLDNTLKPFEDPMWIHDRYYDKDEIGIALNITPGLPDVSTKNSATGGSSERHFRIAQITYQSKRIFATLWNQFTIRGGSLSKKSFYGNS